MDLDLSFASAGSRSIPFIFVYSLSYNLVKPPAYFLVGLF